MSNSAFMVQPNSVPVSDGLADVPKRNEMYHSDVAYDLIGDIHGHSEPLVELLDKLGYRRTNGVFRHRRRQVIFLGDFIDRGPDQRGVLGIVRPMIEDGAALSVMGNHEFNATAYFMPDPDNPGAYLRPHTDKNRRQHGAFLDAFEQADDYADVIDWFRSLPMWLDLPGLRVVHACWDPAAMQILRTRFPSVNTRLDDKLLIAASRKGSEVFEAVETLLKGKEVAMQDGATFNDKDGVPRHHVRIRWFDGNAGTYRKAFLGPESARTHIPDDPIPDDHLIEYSHDAPPVFLGHYWLDTEPEPLAPNVACLDYSVAAKNGGKLVAYRWDGEQLLSRERFVSVARRADTGF